MGAPTGLLHVLATVQSPGAKFLAPYPRMAMRAHNVSSDLEQYS